MLSLRPRHGSAPVRRTEPLRTGPPQLDTGPPRARFHPLTTIVALDTHSVPVSVHAACTARVPSPVVNQHGSHPAVPPGPIPMGSAAPPLPSRHVRISARSPSRRPLVLRPSRHRRPRRRLPLPRRPPLRHKRRETRSGMPDRCAVLSYPNESDALMLYFAPDGLVAVASTHSLLPRAQPTPTTDLVISARRPPFATSFLPSYIKLKKKPTRDVMSVFRAASAWHRRLGPLDATAATIIGGQLHMPKPHFTFRPSIRPNHASWERNEAANSPSAPNLPPGPGRAS